MTDLPAKSRRQLLKLAGVFVLSEGLGAAPAWAVTAPSRLERRTLASFVDMLIPRDTLSGSATDLRVDVRLWDIAEKSRTFRFLLGAGCRWLNQTGGPPFAELSREQRTLLVEWMETSDWNEIPRRFFVLVRQAAVEFYFSQPAAWGALPIKQPPQPLGYPLPW
jgi:hypothetical protein